MRRLLCTLFVCLAVIVVSQPGSADAATSSVCQPTFREARILELECAPGYATERDRITIYSATDFDPAQDWLPQLNYANATWVFDAGADNSANLIIQFVQNGTTYTASVYDSQDGPGSIAYNIVDGELKVRNNGGRPTVVATVQGGWWLADGTPNANIDLSVDGAVIGMIDADIYLKQLKIDGKPDLLVHIRDTNNDGRPDYEWRQVYPPLPEEAGFYHTSVMVNTAGDEPPIRDAIFWPLLGSTASGFVRGDYSASRPAPIQINWKQSKVSFIVESVASRNQPHNFFVYSINRIEEGKLNNVNFESPFAFYQLSPEGGNFPDLAVRVSYWPKGDASEFLPIEQVGYSWRQSRRNSIEYPDWDYSLSLLGRNAQQGTVTLPEFSMQITPYAELPGWVAQNQWDYASFIARESGTYPSSEGIYEWRTLEGVTANIQRQELERASQQASRQAQEDYVKGVTAELPTKFYTTIREGLRGEFRAVPGQPTLTFSPIDRKLHLRDANHGVWTISASEQMRYANLDGDGYLDQWRYTNVFTGTETVTQTRELNVAYDHLVYGDDEQVIIRAAQAPRSVFETLPPTTTAEWEALGSRLAANQRDFAPGDLKGMMQQFPGAQLAITGAQLRDYRPVGKTGFRFVLTLRPGYQINGTDLLNLGNTPAGTYVVTYNGQFSVQPITPPRAQAVLPATAYTQLEPAPQAIVLKNDGLQDMLPATLELLATSPAGTQTTIATDTVTLLAQTTITPTLNWAPLSAGNWTLTARLREQSGTTTDVASAQVSVQGVPVVSSEVLIRFSTPMRTQPFILLLILAFVFVITVTIWRYWPMGKGEVRL